MSDDIQHFLNAADHRLLSAAEEKKLGRRVQAGDHTAKEELILCNIRLVVSVARYYRNRGLPMSDVVQEGIIGLNRAAELYDPERDIRFSTYATLWIKQAIQRGLARGGSAIRLPSTVAGSRAKVRAAQARHPDATVEFLSDLLDLHPREVERALGAAEVVTSLDRRIVSDDHDHSMLDSTADPFAPDPHEEVEDDLSEELREAVASLTQPYRKIIEWHFGLKGKPPMSLQDIALKLGDSTEPPMTAIKRKRTHALNLLRDALQEHM